MSDETEKPGQEPDMRWPPLDPTGVARAVNVVAKGVERSRTNSSISVGDTITLEDLGEDAVSLLLYVENACVESHGLLERAKLNREDKQNLILLRLSKIATVEQVDEFEFPSKSRRWSHRALLTEHGWSLAYEARRARAARAATMSTDAGALSLMMDRRRKRIMRDAKPPMEKES